MDRPNIFIPSNQIAEMNKPPEKTPFIITLTEVFLATLVQFLVVFAIGLLPLTMFLAGTGSISFDRTVITATFLGAIVITAALLLLFKKAVKTVAPKSLSYFILLILWGCFSAYVNTDVYDSVWGSEMEQLTVSFMFLLLLSMLVPLLLQNSRKMQLRLFGFLVLSTVYVLFHTLLRYKYEISLLDFGKLPQSTDTFVGGSTDAAVFAGLFTIFGLISLVMLPLRAYAQFVVTALIALCLSVLILVGSGVVWSIILFSSFVTLGYTLLRKPLFQKVQLPAISLVAKTVVFVVLLISLLGFLTASPKLYESNFSQATFGETMHIVVELYEDNLLAGIGPNRFEDAWRLYKDSRTNLGANWNIDFDNSHSFTTDVFTTYGLVGGVLLILFQIGFLWFGLRTLVMNSNANTVARYLTSVAFAGAVFLWLMTYLYLPSTTILLLTAALTGLTYAAAANLPNIKTVTIAVLTNRVRGFVVLFLGIVVVFTTSVFLGAIYDKYFEQMNPVYTLESQNDEMIAVIADERILDLNRLIVTASPESVTREELITSTGLALEAARRAIELDGTNPRHLERLASLYALLGAIGVDGGHQNALNTLDKIILLDPHNPKHHLAQAKVFLALDDSAASKEAIVNAIKLKSNYKEAIQLETDLAIIDNEVEDMLTRVESIATLDPNNEIRWYQLGVLHSVAGNRDTAIGMLLRAIQLDTTFADARYVLAFQYLATERREEALRQLNLIRNTNPNNTQLLTLIQRVEAGEEIELTPFVPDFTSVSNEVDSGDGVIVPSDISDDFLIPENDEADEGR